MQLGTEAHLGTQDGSLSTHRGHCCPGHTTGCSGRSLSLVCDRGRPEGVERGGAGCLATSEIRNTCGPSLFAHSWVRQPEPYQRGPQPKSTWHQF